MERNSLHGSAGTKTAEIDSLDENCADLDCLDLKFF